MYMCIYVVLTKAKWEEERLRPSIASKAGWRTIVLYEH